MGNNNQYRKCGRSPTQPSQPVLCQRSIRRNHTAINPVSAGKEASKEPVPLAVDRGPRKTLRISYGSLAPIAMAAYAIDARTGRTAAADEWLNDAIIDRK